MGSSVHLELAGFDGQGYQVAITSDMKDSVAPGSDTAMDEAREFASRFCHASTSAIGIAKNILNQSHNQDHRTLVELEASAQSIARSSDFHKEAVRRFKDKEPALFDWEALERAQDQKKAAE